MNLLLKVTLLVAVHGLLGSPLLFLRFLTYSLLDFRVDHPLLLEGITRSSLRSDQSFRKDITLSHRCLYRPDVWVAAVAVNVVVSNYILQGTFD